MFHYFSNWVVTPHGLKENKIFVVFHLNMNLWYSKLCQKGGLALLVEEKSEQSGQNCILRPFRTKSPIYFTVSKTQSDNFRYQGVCQAWSFQVWLFFSFHWLLFLHLVSGNLNLFPKPNVDKYFAKEVQATSHFKDIFYSHLSGDWTTKDWLKVIQVQVSDTSTDLAQSIHHPSQK